MLETNERPARHSSRLTNGVNLDALVETIAAVCETPEVARFRFGAETRWIRGGRTRTVIRKFYGAGQDRTHQQRFVLDADLPAVKLGTDCGPSPSEYLLTALAACLVTALVYQGAARGLRLEQVDAEVSGELDIRPFLGIPGSTRTGYEQICVKFKIKSDASDAQLQELVASARKSSSIVDVLVNPVPIRLETERA